MSSEQWQDVLSTAELALFDSDPENYVARSRNLDESNANIHKDPPAPEGQVELIEDLHSTASDLEQQERFHRCLELIDGFSDLPAKCHLCGKRMATDSKAERFTVVARSKSNEYVPETRVYCLECLDLPEPVTAEKLTAQQRRIRELIGEDWSQSDIAKELGISQPKVSRLWKQSFM